MLAAAGLLMTVFVPAALAYDHGNYAGHTTCLNITPCPHNGGYDDSCHWTIYGRVDNRNVLFGPWHCFGSPTGQIGVGGAIYNRDGARLGVVAQPQSSQTLADMGWMWLDAGQVPVDKNEIPINGGSWSISQKVPNSTLTCTNLTNGSLGNHTLKVSYWDGVYQGPFAGNVLNTPVENDGSGHCIVRTNVDFASGTRHVPSGAPWLDATIGGGGFLGDTKDCYGTASECIPDQPGGDMRFSSWRQAIIDLNNYWEVHGTTYGAWFCANDACT
jgi:hypothetical protein